MKPFPTIRVRELNDAPVRPGGSYVLHWMTAFRRTRWNFSLQRAADWAEELGKPLVVLEALRCDYPWASARLHRFVLEGMADNARSLARKGVLHHAYVESAPRAGKGLLEALAARACLVVTDDYPAFFIPRMSEAAAARLSVRMESVDSNGILPLRLAEKDHPTAHAFRRFLHGHLLEALSEQPRPDPLARRDLPVRHRLPGITSRWPATSLETEAGIDRLVRALPIDQTVGPVATPGGSVAATAAWKRFRSGSLSSYGEGRRDLEEGGTSGLSPYLHFGQISSHQVVAEILRQERWTPARIGTKRAGSREGWWGMTAGAEAFLDQIITWRELGFNMATHRPDHEEFESLPAWALATLREHESDTRSHTYAMAKFQGATTHDPLWNAAQTQLVREGRMHNYLRMLWGKKILEWSSSPREALAVMIELNNRYALDGRDPNSYSGIFWTLGRFDRPWFPERPIFGKVRYMSSENTARKLRVKPYIQRYGEPAPVQAS